MAAHTDSRIVVMGASGALHCIESRRGIASMPTEFSDILDTLADLLQLVRECETHFGGIPIPVAKQCLAALDMYSTALHLAIGRAAHEKGGD
jgi:hypothetical protein